MARKSTLVWKVLAGLTAATVFGGSCSTEELSRIAAGVQAAVDYEDADADVSFGDWLLGELEDL